MSVSGYCQSKLPVVFLLINLMQHILNLVKPSSSSSLSWAWPSSAPACSVICCCLLLQHKSWDTCLENFPPMTDWYLNGPKLWFTSSWGSLFYKSVYDCNTVFIDDNLYWTTQTKVKTVTNKVQPQHENNNSKQRRHFLSQEISWRHQHGWSCRLGGPRDISWQKHLAWEHFFSPQKTGPVLDQGNTPGENNCSESERIYKHPPEEPHHPSSAAQILEVCTPPRSSPARRGSSGRGWGASWGSRWTRQELGTCSFCQIKNKAFWPASSSAKTTD